jgi:hypothetical protein
MVAQLLIGAVFAAVGIFGITYDRRLRRRGKRTTGSVVDLQYEHDGNSGGYNPVIEFRTADGQQVRAVSSAAGDPPPARVGDKVPVLYDPANPSVVEIDTVMGRGTWLALLAAAVGLFFIVTAFVHVR